MIYRLLSLELAGAKNSKLLISRHLRGFMVEAFCSFEILCLLL
jgi:hypothetical protein